MATGQAPETPKEEFDFEEQLRLERLEKERLISNAAEGEVPLYKDADGAVFEWDAEKKAWFPKVDEDFIANYQMNYGVSYDYESMPSSSNRPKPEVTEQPAQNVQPKKRKKDRDLANLQPQNVNPATWFEIPEEKNTSVYVSNIPLDFTEEEFSELMLKCGLILNDPFTKRPKLKLYRNTDGSLKGDGRCCYIKIESVALALQILDGWPLRDNKALRVERAQFQLKGDQFDASKRKRKLSNKEKRQIRERQEKLFDWRPEKVEIKRGRHERIVILKNMFTPDELDVDPDLFNDVNDDIKEEAAKHGPIRKVVVCDRNQDGVAMVYFKVPEDADKCIAAMNGRFYAGKKLEAFTWDGKTKYLVEETEEERATRLQKWYNFLESNNPDEPEDTETTTRPDSVELASTTTIPPSEASMMSSLASDDQSVDTTASVAGSEAPSCLSNDSNNGNGIYRNGDQDLSDNSDGDAAYQSTDEES